LPGAYRSLYNDRDYSIHNDRYRVKRKITIVIKTGLRVMGRPKGGGGDAREKLIDAAGRGFRVGGYGGIGVDGLAKEAGLTSGAFYAHFGSKAEAFTAAVTEGMECLRRGIEQFQQTHGEDWLGPFVDFYLGERMDVELHDACALPTFTSDVSRSSLQTRAAYSDVLKRIVEVIAKGLRGDDCEGRAWQILSVLSGAAGMARAVADPAMRAAIIEAAKIAANAV
jgi:TetR/AcrR family transcriptional regulator, transcriptional repressor for nem operon